MGLGPDILPWLVELRRSGHLPDKARVVEIGAQQLANPFLRAQKELAEVYQAFGREQVALGEARDEGMIGSVEIMPDSAPSSRRFWESIGFSYAAVEYKGHRDSIALDLNRDSVPWRMRGGFDLVVNAGTTEHVVNQDNAFRVIHDLVKPGGLMLHDLPAGGMMTHGVVSYNPQFFWVLCRDNNYEVIDLSISHNGSAPVHHDILVSNSMMSRHKKALAESLSIPVFSVHAILRKPTQQKYVTPLDVPKELLDVPA